MTLPERRRLEQWVATWFDRDAIVLTPPLLAWAGGMVLGRHVTDGEVCEFIVWANTPHYPTRTVH